MANGQLLHGSCCISGQIQSSGRSGIQQMSAWFYHMLLSLCLHKMFCLEQAFYPGMSPGYTVTGFIQVSALIGCNCHEVNAYIFTCFVKLSGPYRSSDTLNGHHAECPKFDLQNKLCSRLLMSKASKTTVSRCECAIDNRVASQRQMPNISANPASFSIIAHLSLPLCFTAVLSSSGM